jgi:Ca2+-binding RTX toxin-like protein
MLVKLSLGDGNDSGQFKGDRPVKLIGGAGSDKLVGGSGDDRVEGDEGHDQLIGGLGADRLEGGEGIDLADYSDRVAGVTVVRGDDKVAAGEPGEGDDVGDDVESVTGGAGDDTLAAGPGGGALTGGDGNDVLTGGEGQDSFSGGAGEDRATANDAHSEPLVCGDGPDKAVVDPSDAVGSDCEAVEVVGLPEPPAPVVQPVPAKPAALPELGESVVVAPDRGIVRVKAPGADGFKRLSGTGEIPVGSTVDAREGAIALTAAAGGGRLDRARFGGAVFSVHQRGAAAPVTELALRGGRFAACPRRTAGSAHVSATAGESKRVVRSLWGNGKGRFRTRGRYSAASVRGTVWRTLDRCDGTLTTVKRGVVEVRDTVRRRTVIVRAGGSYLARRTR